MKFKNRHPSAFISSTFVDLGEERKAVANTLNECGILINALDAMAASNNSPQREIIAGITDSDFTVLILGNRYGTISPSFTGNNETGITEWEYNLSRLRKKPVITLIKKINSPKPYQMDDHDEHFERKQRKLHIFKNRISQNNSPQYFESTDELITVLKKSIVHIYRTQANNNWDAVKLAERERSEANKENTSPPNLNSNVTAGIHGGLLGVRANSVEKFGVGLSGLTNNSNSPLGGTSSSLLKRPIKLGAFE